MWLDSTTLSGQGYAAAEHRYANGKVPWAYDRTAPEVLKYRQLMQHITSVAPHETAEIVDVGCSLGVLTAQLCERYRTVYAVDLSATAAARVKEKLGARAQIAAASALSLPLPDASFDVAVLSDGLVSWQLDAQQRHTAVLEAHRILRPGGHALFGDYLNPRRHADLLDSVQEVFGKGTVTYMHDRLWYIAESTFCSFRGRGFYQWFDASMGWAHGLAAISKLFGPSGSKHLSILVQKAAVAA